ncbi:MAG: response regulator transcription factor [Caldisericaceae bacterium]
MKKILVVDDEDNIRELINIYLKKSGYETIEARDGREAIDKFDKEKPHLVILDLMIPYINGETVAQTIRKKSNVPIIMLTAKVEEDNRVQGLEIGADDYVTKPFSPRELVARVKSVLRRSYPEEGSIKISDLEIYPSEMSVLKNGVDIGLTAKEFKVFFALVRKPGAILSREEIMDQVYNEYDEVVFDRTVDAYIKNIRKKLDDDPKSPRYIESAYGAGYRFKR